ncbi:MAG: ATP-binding protein [Haloferacaceae archaeon]
MDAPVRVLLVGHESFADAAAARLEGSSDRIAVGTAPDADAGFDRLDGGGVDCVVAHRDLPGGSGVEFLAAVREAHPDLPSVLVTRGEAEVAASEAVAAGVTDRCRAGDEGWCRLLAARIEDAVDARRSRRTLRERTRRLETLISNLPGIVYRCRNERGWPMERVEGDAEGLTGYAAEDLEGPVSWEEAVVHPDDRESVWEAVQDALAGDDSFEVTYRIRTADGATKWVWEQGRGVDGPDGSPEALEGFITDVTERASYERRIEGIHDATRRLMGAEAEEEVIEATTEAAREILGFPYSVFRLLDADDRLVPVAVSSGMESLGGQRPAYEIGEPTAGLAFAAGDTCVYDDVRTLDDGIDRGRVRAAIYLPVGDRGVVTIADDDVGSFDRADVDLAEVLVGHAATALDLVDRSRALRRQNERLERFVDVVGHDLRNPLNVADGRIELAARECDSDHLDAAADALDRMGTLIDDLLALAREGERVTDPEPVDLAAVAERCWGHVETADATLAVEAEGTVRADRGRLQQLLENLVRNAVEHGGPGVTVTVGDLPDGFYVADDGPGVPEGKRDRIFEPGFSTDSDGTGLGLAIVREIAEAHGWSIDLAGGADGTRFEITGVDGGS